MVTKKVPAEELSFANTKFHFNYLHDTIPTTELGLAAFNGEATTITKACEKEIDWETEGTHPLRAAILGKHIDLATMLIDAGSPLYSHVLYVLYLEGQEKLFFTLIDRGEELDERCLNNLFLYAIHKNDEKMVAWSLEHGADPDSSYSHNKNAFPGWTELHTAAHACNLEIIERLIAHGAGVNHQTDAGETPLYLAGVNNRSVTKENRKVCIRFLLSKGAVYHPHVPWINRQLLYYFGVGSYSHALLPSSEHNQLRLYELEQ